MEISEILALVGGTAGGAAAVVELLRSIRSQRAEQKYVAGLAAKNPAIGDTLKAFLETTKFKSEADVKRQLNGKKRAEVQLLLNDLEQAASMLPPDQQKSVLQGLEQPSERGRVAYAAKILSQLEAQTNAGIT